MPPDKRPGPLQGLRVIEIAHQIAGPVCGLMLADMGADVIKLETAIGDDTLRSVPPAIKPKFPGPICERSPLSSIAS